MGNRMDPFATLLLVALGLLVQWFLIRSAIVSALKQDRNDQNPPPKIPGTVFN